MLWQSKVPFSATMASTGQAAAKGALQPTGRPVMEWHAGPPHAAAPARLQRIGDDGALGGECVVDVGERATELAGARGQSGHRKERSSAMGQAKRVLLHRAGRAQSGSPRNERTISMDALGCSLNRKWPACATVTRRRGGNAPWRRCWASPMVVLHCPARKHRAVEAVHASAEIQRRGIGGIGHHAADGGVKGRLPARQPSTCGMAPSQVLGTWKSGIIAPSRKSRRA